MAGAMETITETLTVGSGGEKSAGSGVTKKMLPRTENPLVIRTDFSDQGAWEAIMTTIRKTSPEGFKAYVEFLDDPAFQGLTTTQLLGFVSEEYASQHSFLMIVDHVTITEPEHPLVVVNLFKDEDEDEDDEEEDESADKPQYGQEFRAVPAAIQSVENNLSIANMDFEDFADAVDKNRVFRDFGDPTK